MSLQSIAESIRNLNDKKEKAIQYENEFVESNNKFHRQFEGNLDRYIISGILCIAVLIFDFWVSERSLHYLAYYLGIKVQFIAILFTLIDAGLAILANGSFGANSWNLEISKKRWRAVLIILGIIKLVLFVMMVVFDDPSNQFTLSSILEKNIITQALFITVVYSVLTYAGFGLWFLIGLVYFGTWKFLLSDPSKIELDLRKHWDHFKKFCLDNKLDPKQESEEFGIVQIVKQYWN